jgi:hypothetical protein
MSRASQGHFFLAVCFGPNPTPRSNVLLLKEGVYIRIAHITPDRDQLGKMCDVVIDLMPSLNGALPHQPISNTLYCRKLLSGGDRREKAQHQIHANPAQSAQVVRHIDWSEVQWIRIGF